MQSLSGFQFWSRPRPRLSRRPLTETPKLRVPSRVSGSVPDHRRLVASASPPRPAGLCLLGPDRGDGREVRELRGAGGGGGGKLGWKREGAWEGWRVARGVSEGGWEAVPQARPKVPASTFGPRAGALHCRLKRRARLKCGASPASPRRARSGPTKTREKREKTGEGEEEGGGPPLPPLLPLLPFPSPSSGPRALLFAPRPRAASPAWTLNRPLALQCAPTTFHPAMTIFYVMLHLAMVIFYAMLSSDEPCPRAARRVETRSPRAPGQAAGPVVIAPGCHLQEGRLPSPRGRRLTTDRLNHRITGDGDGRDRGRRRAARHA